MDLNSRTAQLCIAGTQAEFRRSAEEAREFYTKAWEAATDDYEAAMAAHYVARTETEPEESLRWNLIALEHARLDHRTSEFMGSLLVNVGAAYEAVGNRREAERHYHMAADEGVDHFRG